MAEGLVLGRKCGFYIPHPSSPSNLKKLPFEYLDDVRIPK